MISPTKSMHFNCLVASHGWLTGGGATSQPDARVENLEQHEHFLVIHTPMKLYGEELPPNTAIEMPLHNDELVC